MLFDLNMVKSPLNYTGGKFKLLPQLMNHFPKEEFDLFIDCFSGGVNVGINVNSNNIVCIDTNKELISLMNYFKTLTYDKLEYEILEKIDYYNLSNTMKYGYEHYKCDSSDGVGLYNKDGYLKLRDDYNKSKSDLLFFLLIIYSFNNQIRFNKKGHFNISVGKRDFNLPMRNKLKLFMDELSNKNISFMCDSFECLYDFDFNKYKNSFVYFDPPYLLGTATYNENGGWNETMDLKLFELIDHLNKNDIKFALSNVLQHKGKFNDGLVKWIETNGYKIIDLTNDYSNSSYQLIDKNTKTREVLIVNY